MEKIILTTQKEIENRIFTIRGMQVMLDSHLAEMYGVETKNLNKAVNRNLERFPEYYRFKLTDDEFKCLRFQFGTSSKESIKSQFSLFDQNHGGRRYLPFVFTEQGVAMLSAVLRSKTAVNVSIQIMNAFVEIKEFHAAHDRFLIIDERELYHLGASLKDLGKRPVVSLSYHGLPFRKWIRKRGKCWIF